MDSNRQNDLYQTIFDSLAYPERNKVCSNEALAGLVYLLENIDQENFVAVSV